MATKIYYPTNNLLNPVSFSKRSVDFKKVIRRDHFPVKDPASQQRLVTVYDGLLEKARRTREVFKRPRGPPRERLEWKDHVNSQRDRIRQAIESPSFVSFAKTSRELKVSRAQVKAVWQELKLRGGLQPYDYNNLHSQEDLDRVDIISEASGRFLSTSQIKKSLPLISRRKIANQLKATGYSYRTLPKDKARLKHKPKPPNHTRMLTLINHLSSAYDNPNREILFIDEMLLPLHQTPRKCWQKVGEPSQSLYNSREEAVVFTAIALCSTRGFEAVQLFLDPITSADFVYFVQNAINHLPQGKAYSLLLDNATWHSSKVIQKTDAWRFFAFNEKGQYMVNLIENAFSGVRALFRARPDGGSLEAEARAILQCFFDEDNARRFRGYYFNHIRAISNYLGSH